MAIKTEDYKTGENKAIIVETIHTRNLGRNSLGTSWERTTAKEITNAHKDRNIAVGQQRDIWNELSKYEQKIRHKKWAKTWESFDIIENPVMVKEIIVRPIFRQEEINRGKVEELERNLERGMRQIDMEVEQERINRMNRVPITNPKLMH